MNPAFTSTIMPPISKSKKLPRVRGGSYPFQMRIAADVLEAKGQIHTTLPNIPTATIILKTCAMHTRIFEGQHSMPHRWELWAWSL